MPSNWDNYRRMQVNIEKSQCNPTLNNLFVQHYQQLHSQLIQSELDEDIFNDTYLKLTYNFNSKQDFIEQYKYYFKLLKGAYYRDSKVTNYLVTPIGDRDFADKIDDEPVINNTNADFIETLKAEIKNI